jgi:hypothetical protein
MIQLEGSTKLDRPPVKAHRLHSLPSTDPLSVSKTNGKYKASVKEVESDELDLENDLPKMSTFTRMKLNHSTSRVVPPKVVVKRPRHRFEDSLQSLEERLEDQLGEEEEEEIDQLQSPTPSPPLSPFNSLKRLSSTSSTRPKKKKKTSQTSISRLVGEEEEEKEFDYLAPLISLESIIANKKAAKVTQELLFAPQSPLSDPESSPPGFPIFPPVESNSFASSSRITRMQTDEEGEEGYENDDAPEVLKTQVNTNHTLEESSRIEKRSVEEAMIEKIKEVEDVVSKKSAQDEEDDDFDRWLAENVNIVD